MGGGQGPYSAPAVLPSEPEGGLPHKDGVALALFILFFGFGLCRDLCTVVRRGHLQRASHAHLRPSPKDPVHSQETHATLREVYQKTSYY